MNPFRFFSRCALLGAILTALVLSGCGLVHKSTLGKLVLADSDTFSLRTSISPHWWPNRLVMFHPVGGGMADFDHTIYDSKIVVTLTNSGSARCSVTLVAGDQPSWALAPGESVELPQMAFKDFRILITPTPSQRAEVTFQAKFDRRYSTKGAWRLEASWSDGP